MAKKAKPKAKEVAAPELNIDGTPKPNYPIYRVEPGSRVSLLEHDPAHTEHFKSKREIEEELEHLRGRIAALQEKLYAERKQSLLIVLQALDTGGKDGTIKSVFQGINPQGCAVHSFKAPSDEERAHAFLWRYDRRTPERGMITLFNRSHYEEVLVVRVKKMIPEDVWRERYAMINAWEHMLALNNTRIVKFFLNISKDEQKKRLQTRLDDPAKHWKFSSNDLKERAFWGDYMAAFEDAMSHCSTDEAPWYVVPANHKWYRNLVVARTIADTLEAMEPEIPAAEAGLERIVIAD